LSGRIAVLASGDGSNAEALATACEDGRIDGEIAVILSNRPDAPVLARSASRGIPAVVVDHRRFAGREAFDAALVDTLAAHGPDLITLAGFMRVLTPVFLQPYRGRILNIHPSLLPRYPGLQTHARAIAAGDREAGATVHFVTAELDAGPGIVQARVPVRPGDDPAALAARVLAAEHRIYPLAVAACLDGRVRLAAGEVLLQGQPLPARGAAPEALEGQARGSVTPR
jgi:phosphoribosylglycinamide formyltransferase-1